MSSRSDPNDNELKLRNFTSQITPITPTSSSENKEPEPPLDLKIFQDQFKNIDIDQSKAISQEEFTKAFAIIPGNNVSISSLIFDAIDSKKEKLINIEQFTYGMNILLKGSKEERSKFSFSIFDRRKRGEIEKLDVLVVINAVYKSLQALCIPEFDNDKAKQYTDFLWNIFDKEKKGKITYDEFKDAIEENGYLLKGLGSLNSEKKQRIAVNSGEIVIFGNKNWIVAFEMMLGIRLSFEYITDLRRQIRKEDFSLEIKIKLPFATDMYFLNHAPHAFELIRKTFKVSRDEYLLSLGPEQVFGNILLGNMSTLSEKISDGKSGSFFFYSHDGRFMVKTLPEKEIQIFLNILYDYFTHIRNNPDTLLVRFYASHKINDTPFVVMGNVFDSPLPVNAIYDLKGSTVGRKSNGGFVKKDLDLKRKFYIGQKNKDRLMNSIKKDVDFLKKLNLIDYSLIVGIIDIKGKDYPKEFENLDVFTNSMVIPSLPNEKGQVEEIYFFGIIDLFTVYDRYKETEHHLKSVVHNSQKISAVPPNLYAERFEKFMESILQ